MSSEIASDDYRASGFALTNHLLHRLLGSVIYLPTISSARAAENVYY